MPNGPISSCGGLLPIFPAGCARGAAAMPPNPPFPPLAPIAPGLGLPSFATFGSAAGITRGIPKPDSTPGGITKGVIVGSESFVAGLGAVTVLDDARLGDCAATHTGSRQRARN